MGTIARRAGRRSRITAPARLTVELQRAARGWAPARATIAAWASAALAPLRSPAELSVRVVARPESRRLNREFRGRDKPTNVLSFPAAALRASPRPLGDLVVCSAVLRNEAREQGKSLRAHWAHLVVHGVLHLRGYDHERAADATRMERREISVLRRLGFQNPYLVPEPGPRRSA
jgi:probable rRNA maturation factor